jgi:hypothetical protein
MPLCGSPGTKVVVFDTEGGVAPSDAITLPLNRLDARGDPGRHRRLAGVADHTCRILADVPPKQSQFLADHSAEGARTSVRSSQSNLPEAERDLEGTTLEAADAVMSDRIATVRMEQHVLEIAARNRSRFTGATATARTPCRNSRRSGRIESARPRSAQAGLSSGRHHAGRRITRKIAGLWSLMANRAPVVPVPTAAADAAVSMPCLPGMAGFSWPAARMDSSH